MTTSAAPRQIRIDFVSDIACPWCVVGLRSLEHAVARTADVADVQVHFQPFELNPQLGPEGEDADEHLARKYGLEPAQLARNREALRARGAELGFAFGRRTRIHNTFDAHRLLHWAGLEGGAAQRTLKHALLEAYHARGEDVCSHDVLARIVEAAGLDGARAREILAGDRYADAVRERERHYTTRGIHAVPAAIFDDRQLVSGGQPVEVFEQAIRDIARGRA